jgi:nucleotide-binding universal stress UspA family protein
MFRRVLLPTDGSDVSIAAADTAIAIAKLAGVPLHAVYVVEPYPFTGIGSARREGFDDYMAGSRQAAAQAFERIVQTAAAQGVQCETLVVEHTQAAAGIVAAAESTGANLIAMGSHGRSGVAKLMLGSVAMKVLQLSPVPVMVIK